MALTFALTPSPLFPSPSLHNPHNLQLCAAHPAAESRPHPTLFYGDLDASINHATAAGSSSSTIGRGRGRGVEPSVELNDANCVPSISIQPTHYGIHAREL
jgi:hypothetical protein